MYPKIDMEKEITNLQSECYNFFGVDSAPIDDREYDKMVDWIEDQLRKSTLFDLLDSNAIEIADQAGCFMVANAIKHILEE